MAHVRHIQINMVPIDMRMRVIQWQKYEGVRR